MAACAGPDPPPSAPKVDAADAALPADATAAAGPETTVGPDGATLCRAAGCPCTAHSTCATACVERRDGQQLCGVACGTSKDCPYGEICELVAGAKVCVDATLTLCDPCNTQNDCKAPGAPGAACVAAADGGGRCGVKCLSSTDCPPEFACEEVTTTGGAPTRQCVPAGGACACSPRAIAKQLSSACAVANSAGKCLGKRTCVPGGLTPCDGPEPKAELCNGLDDNCNNATDEGASCDDNNPCSNDVCQGKAGCEHSDAIEACDDDNPCTLDTCDKATGCAHVDQPDCVVKLPYKQPFACGSKAAWEVSSAPPGSPRWTLDATPGLGVFTPGYRSPFCSLNFNLGPSLQCAPDGADALGMATSPWFSTAGMGAQPALAVHYWLAGTWRTQDVLSLQLQAKGQTGWQTVQAHEGGALGGAWQRHTVKLPAPAPTAFRLRWHMAAPDCAKAANLTGPFVDDVEVKDAYCKKASDCDDDNPCTDDVCVPSNKLCNHKALSSGACSDGNPCTLQDACKLGACQGKAALGGVCDDNNPCTVGEKCSGGECSGSDWTGACDDGNPCTQGDTCKAGVCGGATATACDDKNPCTYDVCDLYSGKCAAAPAGEGGPCDDGDPCSDLSLCHAGTCVPRFACDDHNPCTQDYCAGSTCSHFKMLAGTPCSDGSACTDPDLCTAAGKCEGPTVACATVQQAAIACSGPLEGWSLPEAATGEAAWRIVAVPATAGLGCALGFSDGQGLSCGGKPKIAGVAAWTVDLGGQERPTLRLKSLNAVGKDPKVHLRWIDVAAPSPSGIAVTPLALLTNDDDPPGVWRPLRFDLKPWKDKQIQVRLVFDSVGCPETPGLGWLVRDLAIESGSGQPCAAAKDCDDANNCTADICLQSGSCAHQPQDGSCNDGTACTSGDSCTVASDCAPGKPTICDDKDACTLDACLAAVGCVFAPRPDGDPCPDGNACTIGDFCINGVCATRDKCDDGNPCTKDSCVAGGTCLWDKVNGGAPCDDGSPCTSSDHCSMGTCVGKPAPCAITWQNPVQCGDAWQLAPLPAPGTVAFAVDATPAPPGYKSAGCSLNVNDGVSLPCTDGVAGKASATSTPISLAGLANPALWLWSWHDVGTGASQNLRVLELSADGFQTVPVALWQDNAVGSKTWRRVRVNLGKLGGKTVQVRLRWAGLNCTAQSGKGWFVDDLQVVSSKPELCKTADQCDDGEPCTDGVCEFGMCLHHPSQATCNDGDACTVSDQCWKGQCQGKAKECSDGNPCTLDSCDPAAGCSSVVKVDGSKCDDGNSCSGPDSCTGGVCGGPTVVADGAPCTSSAACTKNQTCFKGKCQAGTMTPDGTACDDGNPCSPTSACDNSLCKSGTQGACDDGEPCTLDSCAPTAEGLAACAHTDLPNAVTCDDGDPCTANTACLHGVCEGPQVDSCVLLAGSPFDGCALPPTWDTDPIVSGIGWKVDALPAAPTPHSAPCSLNYNNDSNVDVGVPIKGAVTLPTLQVPLQGMAQLALFSWHDGEVTALKDKRTVEVFLQGSSIVQDLVQLPNHLRRGRWTKVRVPLHKFAGKAIVVKLRYDTVDQFDNETPGWFVDDVRVQVAQPASCANAASCAQATDPCKPTQCIASVCVPAPLQGACDDGDACTVGTTCQKGQCLGGAKDCDDGYACSADLCDPGLGCYHKLIDNCGEVTLPYEATFSCGQAGNTYWLRDGPVSEGAPAWAMDASPAVPPPLSPDCSLNCNDGAHAVCPAGVAKIDQSAVSPLVSLQGLKFGAPVKARVHSAGTWQPAQGEVATVELQPLGNTKWTLLGTLQPSTAWTTHEFDLSPWGGLKVKLRARFVTACTPGAGQGSGPFIDDVQVFDASCKSSAVCNDNNPCTADICDLASGQCKAEGQSGATCDDSNPCTVSDACVSGQCLGSPKPCDDGQPCTADACDAANGACIAPALPDGSACSDGQSCTTGDQCTAKVCGGKAKVDGSPCSDGNPCTLDDGCAAGKCAGGGQEPDGSPCTDGNPCTAGDVCGKGLCVGGKNACDDGDPCTDDVCTPVGSVGKKCESKKACP
ncbi:MAG: hypothetical protein FJ100_06895 [Deltaproteobacteria bacterium]|nr:hypothetical protein [Deltaproteobacteria bacterium]